MNIRMLINVNRIYRHYTFSEAKNIIINISAGLTLKDRKFSAEIDI